MEGRARVYYCLLSRVLPGGFIDLRTSDLQTHGHGRRPLTDEVDKELILSPSSKTGQHMLAAAVAYGHLMRRFEWKSSKKCGVLGKCVVIVFGKSQQG